MTLALADVSEFQKAIDWAAYGAANPAVVVRVHNGWRPDNNAQPNIAGARRSCPWRGWYQYLPASVDPVKAAHAFQTTLGPTLPGEVMILDLEAGIGDQRARRQAWLDALQDPIEWTYSGLSFARTHLPGVRVDWIAAYQQAEPTDAHTLWQNTNARRFAGIPAPCDGSLFNGTLAQLQALTNSPPEVDMTITQADAEHIAAEVWRYDQAGAKPQAWGFLQKAATPPAPPIDVNALAAAIVAAGGVGVTAAAIAKAVNDDAAKRLVG